MPNQSFGTAAKERKSAISYTLIGMVAGAAVGGGIGYFAGPETAAGVMVMMIVGLIVGAIVGGMAGFVVQYIITSTEQGKEADSASKEIGHKEKTKLMLKEERLDISKERVKLHDVKVHRERITEEKTITVPVVREEVVIETIPADQPGQENQTSKIRIPVKEERLEVIKHEVVTGDVDIYKNEYQTTEAVTETLQREEAKVNVSGEADVKEHTAGTPR